MSSIRRFGASGIRRGLRQSIDGGAAASPDSLDALWADYGASANYWYQGGVGRSGDTWTDRVSSAVLSGAGVTMSDTTIGSADAVRMALDAGAFPTATVPALGPFRTFVLVRASAPGAPSFYVAARYGAGLTAISLDSGQGTIIGDDGVTQSIVTISSYLDGSPHALRWEYVATNASHSLRVDGAASPAPAGGDAIIADALATTVEMAISIGAAATVDIALAVEFPHASLDNTQAADIESRLIALGGI